MRDDGSMSFRTPVPLRPGGNKVHPAADGQMGCVMKVYREWMLGASDEWLRKLWPNVKRAVEYANSQVGFAFGYLALAGVSIYLLTGLPLRLMRSNHQICSELVVRALQAGGLLKDADPALSLPADLAKRFGVLPKP